MNQLEQIEERWAAVQGKTVTARWVDIPTSSSVIRDEEARQDLPALEAAMTNAPTDIEYLLRRLKAAEAVIQTVEFHNDGSVTFVKAGSPFIEAWHEVAE